MINYSIEPEGNGCKLTVWEPAPITSERAKPFIFKASYSTSSPLEAFNLLRLFQEGKAVAQIPKHRLREYVYLMSIWLRD